MKAQELLDCFVANSRQYEEELRSLREKISESNDKEIELRRSISSAYRRFAAVQINENNRIDSDVERQMRMRKQEEEGLHTLLKESEVFIARETIAAQGIQAQLDDARAKVQASLSRNPKYATLYERHQLILERNGKAAALDEKLLAEYETKIPLFEQSPLYVYLKNRHYGGPRYAPNSVLSRIGDHLLARLCAYERNRAAEKALRGLPASVEESRKNRENELIQAEDERNMLEVEISGDVRELTRLLRTKESIINQAKKQAETINQQIDAFSSNADVYYQKSLEIMSEELAGMSLEELRERASETAADADDIASTEIGIAMSDLDTLEREVRRLHALRHRANEMHEHAKRIERRMLDASFSSRQYSYSSTLDVETLIKAYMAGSLSEAMLTQTIRAAQHNESRWEKPEGSSSQGVWNPASSRTEKYEQIGGGEGSPYPDEK